jgi:hypothetical protein
MIKEMRNKKKLIKIRAGVSEMEAKKLYGESMKQKVDFLRR